MKKIFLLLVVCLSLTSCLSTKKVTGSIYKTQDKFQQCSFYRNKSAFSQNKCFDIYIVEADITYPRLVFTYSGDDWIFFDKAIFLNKQDETIDFDCISYEKETNVDSKNVTESIDMVITKEEATRLKSVLEGGFVRLRLQGKKSKTYILKTKGLIELLDYYLNEM